MAARRHGGVGKNDDELSGAQLLLGEQHAVEADAEAIHGRADCHEGAIEARSAVEIEARTAVATPPVAPAEDVDFAMDQRVLAKIGD